MKLKNKTAVITGGSRGIGKAIAKAFLSEGAQVLICARGTAELKETVKTFKSAGFHDVIGLPIDISDREQADKLMLEAEKEFGSIDILVNNAGTPMAAGPFSEVDMNDWVGCLENNLLGAIFCTKAVLPRMISRNVGKIINLSGGGAVGPNPSFSAYAVSKVGLVRFTETLAIELKEYNIQINAIAPGPTDTHFFQKILEFRDKIGEIKYLNLMNTKKKGLNQPDSSCELAVFLASDQSNKITGKLISPRWDAWADFNEKLSEIQDTSLFTLRRIDSITWFEKND